jgi:hypothetical protein
MEKQAETDRTKRFTAYIEARRFDPPRPLLLKAAALVGRKEHALDVGAGALNASKYLLSAGFGHVTALDASPRAQKAAAEFSREQVTFVLSRFEDFPFPANSYDLVNAEFSLPFINPANFESVFTKLLNSIRGGGIFTGQLFGSNDSWNVENSGMSFHPRGSRGAAPRLRTRSPRGGRSPRNDEARRVEALAYLPHHRCEEDTRRRPVAFQLEPWTSSPRRASGDASAIVS